MEVKMEVIEGSCSLYYFYFLWCSQPSSKVDNSGFNTFVLFNSPFNSLFYFLFNSRNIHEYEL